MPIRRPTEEQRAQNRARAARYHAAHRDERRAYREEWRRLHPEYAAQWRASHPDYDAQWRASHPERVAQHRQNARVARYGLTFDEYRQIFDEQGGLCCICFFPINLTGRQTHIDHDHETGEIRGILCSTCNTILGLAHDDAVRLQTAAQYLGGL